MEEFDVLPKGSSVGHQNCNVHVCGHVTRRTLNSPAQRLLTDGTCRLLGGSDQLIHTALARLHPQGAVHEVRQSIAEDANGHPEYDNLHYSLVHYYRSVDQNCCLHFPELRRFGYLLSL